MSTHLLWQSFRSLVPVSATCMISYCSEAIVPQKSELSCWWNVVSQVVSISNLVWEITDSWFEALGQRARTRTTTGKSDSKRTAQEAELGKVALEVGPIISAREGMITELVHPRHLSIEDWNSSQDRKSLSNSCSIQVEWRDRRVHLSSIDVANAGWNLPEPKDGFERDLVIVREE